MNRRLRAFLLGRTFFAVRCAALVAAMLAAWWFTGGSTGSGSVVILGGPLVAYRKGKKAW